MLFEKKEERVDSRETKQYKQGAKAYQVGLSDEECPHPKGSKNGLRESWFDGWLDARTNDRLAAVFERNGMTHP